MSGSAPPGLQWWLWPISCVVAIGFGGRRALIAARRNPSATRPQFYLADLMVVSLVLAIVLTIVKHQSRDNFIKYAVLIGLAVTAAMLLALLNASRRGFHRGPSRGMYATGSVLTLFGLGGAALLLFFILLVLIVETGSSGPVRAIERLNEMLFYNNDWKRVTWFGVAGAISLAIGLVLCAQARRLCAATIERENS
jgi:uncharacterized BrkB/YihY/UPF0761 family membrane protein